MTDASRTAAQDSQAVIGAFIEIAPRDGAEPHVLDGVGTPVAGWPIAVKDNIDVDGMRTTAGTQIWRDYRPARDAHVVQALREAGASVVGKTNMDELGWGGLTDNPHYGPTNNPWNLERFVGGSSGGSAAAVAAGVCRAALGTDTGGSVRLPAAFTGLVGFRPTWGLVSTDGVRPLAPSMDVVGALATCVEDVAHVLDTIGPQPRSRARSGHRDKSPFRERELVVGVDRAAMNDVVDDVATVTEQAIASAAASGCRIVEVSIEDLDSYLEPWIVLHLAEPSEIYRPMLTESASMLSADVRARLLAGLAFTSAELRRAAVYRSWFASRFGSLLLDVDVILTPTVPFPAVPHGTRSVRVGGVDVDIFALLPRFTGLASMWGAPAVSLPAGLSGDGLPIGIQLIGRPHHDDALVSAAQILEGAIGWSARPPYGFRRQEESA